MIGYDARSAGKCSCFLQYAFRCKLPLSSEVSVQVLLPQVSALLSPPLANANARVMLIYILSSIEESLVVRE